MQSVRLHILRAAGGLAAEHDPARQYCVWLRVRPEAVQRGDQGVRAEARLDADERR